jgi:hypothetical protein
MVGDINLIPNLIGDIIIAGFLSDGFKRGFKASPETFDRQLLSTVSFRQLLW